MARLAKENKLKRQQNLHSKENVIKVRDNLKSITKDNTGKYDANEKLMANIALEKRKRDESKSRATSRCFSCGRVHAVTKKLGLCRLCIRKYLALGWLPGFRKSSW